jgi:hypothetical protein
MKCLVSYNQFLTSLPTAKSLTFIAFSPYVIIRPLPLPITILLDVPTPVSPPATG